MIYHFVSLLEFTFSPAVLRSSCKNSRNLVKQWLALDDFPLLFLQKKRINKEEDMLGCEVRSAFSQIQEIIDAKEPFDKLWRAVVTFHEKNEQWLGGSILQLNSEEIEETVT